MSQIDHGNKTHKGKEKVSNNHNTSLKTSSEGLFKPEGMNTESFPSSVSDADSQKMMSNELAVQKPSLTVDSPSRENELLSLKSPSVGESV